MNQKHPFELIHTKMCKNILGVHRKASDIMSKAELGRFPLMSNIVKNCFNYWQHILKADSSTLLSSMYTSLFSNTAKIRDNYFSRFNALMCCLEKEYLPSKPLKNPHKEAKDIQQKMNNLYIDHFFNILHTKAERTNSGGRFEIYRKVKFNYKFENYLHLDNKLRRHITSIRISTHNLPIEALRRHSVERKNRICNCCNNKDIGSEKHVLMYCNNTEITSQRNLLFEKIFTICTQWKSLSTDDKFLYLLLAHDHAINFYFAVFLEKIYRIVNEHKTK